MRHSSLQWIQIPAKDVARAAKFYENVFGFAFFFEDLNDIPHAVFKEGPDGVRPVNGAIIQVEDELSSRGPVLFFDATSRFDDIEEAILENGGKLLSRKALIRKKIDSDHSIIPLTYIDEAPGYFARFLDSEGNRMGLYGAH